MIPVNTNANTGVLTILLHIVLLVLSKFSSPYILETDTNSEKDLTFERLCYFSEHSITDHVQRNVLMTCYLHP
jgi:hypothetical protein